MSRVRISFPAPNIRAIFIFLAKCRERRYSQVVRPRSAKPLSPGSNPGGASKENSVPYRKVQSFYKTCSRGGIGRRKGLKSICVENHSQICEFLTKNLTFTRRCGGIGRRKGLKIPRSNIRAGSSPASGTTKNVS